MWIRMAPGPSYRPVACLRPHLRRGVLRQNRRAVSRKDGHSRTTSCARLPGNRPSTGRAGVEPSARRPRRGTAAAGRSRSGVADERRRDAAPPGKNGSSKGRITATRRTAVSLRTRPHAPRPHLRRDVVEHRDPRRARAAARSAVVAGLVHEDDEVIAVGLERPGLTRASSGNGPGASTALDEATDIRSMRSSTAAPAASRAGADRTPRTERPGRGGAAPSRPRRVRVPAARLPTRRCAAPPGAHGRAVARGEAWTASADAEGERQRLRAGRARHRARLLPRAPRGRSSRARAPRVRPPGLEPHVARHLLEACGTEILPAGLEAKEIHPSLARDRESSTRWAEDPQLAHALARDAARGHVRDGALANSMRALAISTCASRAARRWPDIPPRAHQFEHQIEVVDHEIEDDGHIVPRAGRRAGGRSAGSAAPPGRGRRRAPRD